MIHRSLRKFVFLLCLGLAVGAALYSQTTVDPTYAMFQSPLAPPNDNFADAIAISGLPFDKTVDTSSASLETDEVIPSCAVDGFPTRTVWYTFTPTVDQLLTAQVLDTFFNPFVGIYTGSSVNNLHEVSCNSYYNATSFRATAGTTYYFQTGSYFDEGGSARFNLIVTPPPIADFSYWPYDPSKFDTVQFYDASYDPANYSYSMMQTWTFSDGTTATGCCPIFNFGADGDYTVNLTVTTADGRTASTAKTVQVRTRDVAITKFNAPNAAGVGQTRQISVGLNSKLSDETVEVQLYKSSSYGYQFVGTLSQVVPVRSGNRTTDFAFSYTFTAEDKALGKVTFKAIANMLSGRDALSADNEAVSSPTKIN